MVTHDAVATDLTPQQHLELQFKASSSSDLIDDGLQTIRDGRLSTTNRDQVLASLATGLGRLYTLALDLHRLEIDHLPERPDPTSSESGLADLHARLFDILGLHPERSGSAADQWLCRLSADPVADGDPEEWLTMYERNVLAALRVTRAFLPLMRERGGDVVFLTSTAAHDTYPGGAGYVAAKHGERIIANTLRVELVGEPVRVIEIAPGMVATSEFSLNRFHGDRSRADAVYAGVEGPLSAQDIAECITWALERPAHVNIDSMIVRPRAQASNTVVARG